MTLFLALGNDVLEFYRSDKAATTNLLTGHVITPQIVSTADMINGTLNYTNPLMTPIATSITQTANSTNYMVNDATIFFRNILANNGIIHGNSSVFVVPGAEVPAPTTPSSPSTSDAVAYSYRYVAPFMMTFL
jgi:uncharacterized surface protein with fasciclin (FAS1) repeats